MSSDVSINNVNVQDIVPNKYQPRKNFDEKQLTELAESIKNHGIINPILVRKKDEKYEIIAGERRYRAAKMIGMDTIPVIVKNVEEQQMAELALIENIHRQGLNPIEEAKSYEDIMRIGNQTQQSLAIKIGKSQSSIANKIRLLQLPSEIQTALIEQKISERHARSLMTITDKEKQLEILDRIINERLTVKETENLINKQELDQQEIQEAINEIMKSLNIKEEKEDEKMNNGNFFPNFDNNMNTNNNATLNSMNMQSITPQPENVMPTPPVVETPLPTVPQPSIAPTAPENPPLQVPPVTEPTAPVINNAPLFEITPPVAQTEELPTPEAPLFATNYVNNIQPSVSPEIPQFNEELTVPTGITPELTPPPINETFYEVPVNISPVVETPTVDNFSKVQELLSTNGIAYKAYSNDQGHCIIIEL